MKKLILAVLAFFAFSTAAFAAININSASEKQLAALPGVGPVTAKEIIKYRQQHHGFKSVAELKNVKGIGDAKMKTLAPLVTTSGTSTLTKKEVRAAKSAPTPGKVIKMRPGSKPAAGAGAAAAAG